MKATFLAVALGGEMDAVFRYSSMLFINEYSNILSYFTTQFVNIFGSFAAGCLIAFISFSVCYCEPVRLLPLLGLLGILNIFSIFLFDSYTLLQRQDFAILEIYEKVCVFVFISFFAVGYWALKIGG